MTNHDVISAFLDDEPFDAVELGRALAEADGRELLLDLIALRALVHSDSMEVNPSERRRRERQKWIAAGFLAASVVFGAGAAWLLPPLLRQTPAEAPPRPHHVVTFETGTDLR